MTDPPNLQRFTMSTAPFGSPSQFNLFTKSSIIQQNESAEQDDLPPLPPLPTLGNNTRFSKVPASPPNSNPNPTQAVAKPQMLKPLPAQPIDLANFEGFRFATLDAMLARPRDIYLFITGGSYWYPFENSEDMCFQHIKNECGKNRVFLITTGGLGHSIVPRIHDLPQVYAIYIYCVDVVFHSQWAKTYEKVRVVTDQDDYHIIPQLAVDIAQTNSDWADALFQAGNNAEAKEKYSTAVHLLNYYGRQHDPTMLTSIQEKLKKCSETVQ